MMSFRAFLTLFYIAVTCYAVSLSIAILTYGFLLADARSYILMGTYIARQNDMYVIRVREDKTCAMLTDDTIAETQKKIGQVAAVIWVNFEETKFCATVDTYLQTAASMYTPLVISVFIALALLVIVLFFEYRYYKERKIKETMEMMHLILHN